jgi:hypothetical protein
VETLEVLDDTCLLMGGPLVVGQALFTGSFPVVIGCHLQVRELLIVKNEGRANAAWLLEEGSVTVQQGASMVADSLTIAENQTRQEYKGPSLDMRGTATVITQLQTASLRIVGGGDWTVQSGMFLLQSSSLEAGTVSLKNTARLAGSSAVLKAAMIRAFSGGLSLTMDSSSLALPMPMVRDISYAQPVQFAFVDVPVAPQTPSPIPSPDSPAPGASPVPSPATPALPPNTALLAWTSFLAGGLMGGVAVWFGMQYCCKRTFYSAVP